MRLLLRLSGPGQAVVLPVFLGRWLQAVVYQVISAADMVFATWLHDHGYGQGRPFKLFTFGPLRASRVQLMGDKQELTGPDWSWEIRTPIQAIAEPLARGFFQLGEINICLADSPVLQLRVAGIEILPCPDFQNGLTAVARTPMVLSRPVANGSADYLLHDDGEWTSRMQASLERKVRLSGLDAVERDDEFEWQWDEDYLRRRVKPPTQLVSFNRGAGRETKVRGVLAPFTVRGSPELLRIGYLCGFGDKSSSGFGFVDEVNRR